MKSAQMSDTHRNHPDCLTFSPEQKGLDVTELCRELHDCNSEMAAELPRKPLLLALIPVQVPQDHAAL